MPRAEPETLGMSSLDQLRSMREEKERRTAAGRRGVVHLSLDEVHPDPDQVRRDFAGEAVDDGDAEDLRGLARSIAAIGIHNPIHVRSDAELGGYRIVSGERRWRAAGIAGLEEVPCLVDDGGDPSRHRVVQLVENLQRSDLKLVDVASALRQALDETGLSQSSLAKELGKSKSWVSKHLALLKAAPRVQEALGENRLGSLELARLFGCLPATDQERLLDRARKRETALSHTEVARLEKRRKRERQEAREREATEADGAEETRDAEPPIHVLRFTTPQLERLVRRLGGDPAAAALEEEVFRLLES